MKKDKDFYLNTFKSLLVLALFFVTGLALGWHGPVNKPPKGNFSKIINSGLTDQTKEGTLTVSKIFDKDDNTFLVDPEANSVFQNLYISGILKASKLVDMEDNLYFIDPSDASNFKAINLSGAVRNTWPSGLPACPAGKTLISTGSGWECGVPPTAVAVPPTCIATFWNPDVSSVCSGESFVQTSNCGETRTVIGTKSCAVVCVPNGTTTKTCIDGWSLSNAYLAVRDSCGGVIEDTRCPRGCAGSYPNAFCK
ncbi:MAG: hypothetical protein V1851_02165 [Patescibacteria group bacterium]